MRPKGVSMCLVSYGFEAEVCTIAILGETGLGKVSVPIMSLGSLERTAGRCEQLAPPGRPEIMHDNASVVTSKRA